MSKKKNTIHGVLVIGEMSIPATVKVAVDLDLRQAGFLVGNVTDAEPTEPVDEESVAPEQTEAFDLDEPEAATPAEAAPTEAPTVSRVDKVRRAIDRLRSIGQYDAPRSVVDKFPAGYSFQQADSARTRILDRVAANLTEANIDAYVGNPQGFYSQVSAQYGGDQAVAEYIHSVLAEAANS